MSKRNKPVPLALTPGWVEYLRTSDEDSQAPERSQGYQHRLIVERLIEPSGLALLNTYADTMSGKKVNRVNYQRLLADARQGKFSAVAIAFVDRFGRNDLEGIRAYDELKLLGIKVRIATYPSLEPEKPDARMIVSMLFSVAQFESARTAERTREGMIQTLLRGDWAWRAPDGYRNIEIPKSELEGVERLKHAKHKHAIVSDTDRLPIWREAFELLLANRMTLADICEVLHSRGYRLRSGKPFVEVDAHGKRLTAAKYLSNAFHNWFYTGWLVVDNGWLTVPPGEIRGHWEAIVTTDEFERGLAILAHRNRERQHKIRRFYLLQGLVFLEEGPNQLRKLTCSTPNANRDRGGVAYYCVPSSDLNFLCHNIDGQIARWLHSVCVDEQYLPGIRAAYRADMDSYLNSPKAHERLQLEKALKDVDDAELFFARQYQAKKFSSENWERMAREWQDQRIHIRASLQAIACDQESQIASLDDALNVIAKMSILYGGLAPDGQQELLRLMVERIVLCPEGHILRVEMKAPFGYLSQLIADNSEPTRSKGRAKLVRTGKSKTSSVSAAGSTYGITCAPIGLPRQTLLQPFMCRAALYCIPLCRTAYR